MTLNFTFFDSSIMSLFNKRNSCDEQQKDKFQHDTEKLQVI